MTLLEAVASGKDFRVRNTGMSFVDANFEKIELTKDQVLSGDWELSRGMVTIAIEELESLQEQVLLANQVIKV